MKRRAMIDLETLGRKPGCVILEIGICCNFPDIGTTGDWHFSVPVWVEMQPNRHIEPDTIAWWMRHPDAWSRIVANQTSGRTVSPEVASSSVVRVLSTVEEIWANSPSFDCDILSEFLLSFLPRQKTPFWSHRMEADFRTARFMRPDVEYIPPRDSHGALTDAIAQAAHLDRLGIWHS